MEFFFPKQFTVGVLNSFLNRCPALSRLWCPALWLSPIHLSPPVASHLSPNLAPAPSKLWRSALWLSPSHLSPLIASHLSPSLAVPALRLPPIHLSPFFSPIRLLPLIAIHSPSLAGGVWLSGCLQFMCLPFMQFIWLPVWQVASGSLAVSNSFVSPVVSGSLAVSHSFVSPYSSPSCKSFGWWCPALRLSPSFVSPSSNSFVCQSGWWCPAL